MKSFNSGLFDAYENMRYVKYDELEGLIPYDKLPEMYVPGVLKASFYKDGKLVQKYSEQDCHVCVVAATGLGKTTSFVVQQLLSFLNQKVKRSMFISDPKGELFRMLSAQFKAHGYNVLQYNLRDSLHSERWNPLLSIYRKYQSSFDVFDEVGTCETEEGVFNTFRGKIYKSQKELDDDLNTRHNMILDDVGNDIDRITLILFPTKSTKDPSWEDSAREVLRGIIWGMLEDSREEDFPERLSADNVRQIITEELFSLNTVLTIINSFEDGGTVSNYEDGGFFTSRDDNARSVKYVKGLLLRNAPVTRRGIMSLFNTGMSIFRENTMRLVMCANTVNFSEIADTPTVIFINYKDEVKLHYQIISMMVQDIYCSLIEAANKRHGGKLDVPFYFMLDEFGNFPPITDFDTTISACRGRNIFFCLIIQSYAQLNSVYGNDVAEIIRDNLNVHIFYGSNNPKTVEEFSRECGEMTRLSPLSALNGEESGMTHYQIETIPLVPKSKLARFEAGECIVTEANSGHVLWSRIERYYNCPEFSALQDAEAIEYEGSVNPFDPKYTFKPKKHTARSAFDI